MADRIFIAGMADRIFNKKYKKNRAKIEKMCIKYSIGCMKDRKTG